MSAPRMTKMHRHVTWGKSSNSEVIISAARRGKNCCSQTFWAFGAQTFFMRVEDLESLENTQDLSCSILTPASTWLRASANFSWECWQDKPRLLYFLSASIWGFEMGSWKSLKGNKVGIKKPKHNEMRKWKNVHWKSTESIFCCRWLRNTVWYGKMGLMRFSVEDC